MNEAWQKGISLGISDGRFATFRIALSCVSCDLPACKKVCGFLGHNAKYGCHKCMKVFENVTFGQTDYSGYDRDNWPTRTGSLHRLACKETLKESTQTGIRTKESEVGCRYSILLHLPYFDPVKNTVIDPMHNLYLGTGKMVFKLWVDLGIIGKNELSTIDERCSLFTLPNSIGRLPTNISSNYGGFKAAQWRSWITIYSPIVLKGILPDDHLRCWLLYVRACCILGSRILTHSNINTADLLLLTFCKKFEQLYGKEHCTPNMHLHLHLKQCLFDFGPAHSFWCFSFERYNGMLGSYHTNQKNIELQIMRKFINCQTLINRKSCAHPHFLSIIQPETRYVTSDVACFNVLNKSTAQLPGICFEVDKTIHLLPPVRRHIFPANIVSDLDQLYKALYPESLITSLSAFYMRSGRAEVCGEILGSVLNATSNKSAATIMAYWPERCGTLAGIENGKLRVGCVQYYCQHKVKMSVDQSSPKTMDHVLAYVSWKESHTCSNFFGSSATLCATVDERSSHFSFIPVQRIYAIAATCIMKLNVVGFEEKLLIAAPVPMRLSF